MKLTKVQTKELFNQHTGTGYLMAETDKYIFNWIKQKTANLTTNEELCSFYVQNFVFKNDGFLERLQRDYKLPDDFIKLHQKILKLVEVKNNG